MERHEIEQVRRSIVMLSPRQFALRREEAIAILEELAEVREQLDKLRAATAWRTERSRGPASGEVGQGSTGAESLPPVTPMS